MKSRRVGRGGKRGKTSGRGGKGQTARSGNKIRPEWRDLIKKIPKRRGYGRNRSRTVVPRIRFAVVSLSTIANQFKQGNTVSGATLARLRLVRRISGKIPPVKIVGIVEEGSVLPKLSFENVVATLSAKAAIEKSGGTIKAVTHKPENKKESKK